MEPITYMNPVPRFPPQFIKVVFAKQYDGGSNGCLYINVNRIAGFRWWPEALDGIPHIHFVVWYPSDYIGAKKSDLFWILPQEFEKLLMALTGEVLELKVHA